MFPMGMVAVVNLLTEEAWKSNQMAGEHRIRKSKLATDNRGRYDAALDRLERKLEEVRVAYEQYFTDILPQPPDQAQKEIALGLKNLLRAPFKNSTARFRLQALITRYQTYYTYWERVKKQREEGTYVRDVFKAELREKEAKELAEQSSAEYQAEKGLRQLFGTYENALKKAGNQTDKLDYETFKKSLIAKARQMKEKHGAKKLSYKIVVKDGKVIVKTSVKD